MIDITTATPAQCQARRKDGRPCQSFTVNGSDYCFMHDPSRARERAEARSKGGKARHGRHIGKRVRATEVAGPLEISSVADVLALLERSATDLLKLENSVARARGLVSVATAALKALEVGELEDRLSALERVLVNRDGG